jgi:Leucine-rich repeat (LRR) protein
VRRVDEAWIEEVAGLSAQKQVAAVAKKLQELNPGFDGTLKPKIENDVVTGLEVLTDAVTDLSPLRGLTGLRELDCSGSFGKGSLTDLTPLKGMSLTALSCAYNRITDLSPLRGMPLQRLNLGASSGPRDDPPRVTDLTPLKGMKLAVLGLTHTGVSDLSPLAGMPLSVLHYSHGPLRDLDGLRGLPLEHLLVYHCEVADLSPLRGVPLRSLKLHSTRVADLSPLRGLPLAILSCKACPVSDLSSVAGLPLEEIELDFNPWRGDREALAVVKALRTINGQPAAEFWKPYDAFDAWCRDVAKMPADKQVDAVALEL